MLELRRLGPRTSRARLILSMDGAPGSLVWRPPSDAIFLGSQVLVARDSSRAAGSMRLTRGELKSPPRASTKARAAGQKEISAQRAGRRAACERRQPTQAVGDLTVCEMRSITPSTLTRCRACYTGSRDWLTTTHSVVAAREGDPAVILAEYFEHLYEMGRPASDARDTLYVRLHLHPLTPEEARHAPSCATRVGGLYPLRARSCS